MGSNMLGMGTDDLAGFCRKNHIKKLAIFGSALRDDFRPDSDLDVLVEFDQGRVPGLRFFAIQEELSKILGRQVDLHTKGFLGRHIREQVISQAKVQYDAT